MKLTVKNLNFNYDTIPVLCHINFDILSNEIVLIKGVNGSGKTTLLKCIAGILNSGRHVYIDDVELNGNKKLFQHISYIMAEDTLYDYLTVDENIKLFAELFGESNAFFDKVNNVINMMNLSEYRHYLVKHLSQGTRHKVYLSIMLSKNADILILDEPFSSVDKQTQDVIFQYLMSIYKEKIIIYVTHIKEFEQLATRTILLEKVER